MNGYRPLPYTHMLLNANAYPNSFKTKMPKVWIINLNPVSIEGGLLTLSNIVIARTTESRE